MLRYTGIRVTANEVEVNKEDMQFEAESLKEIDPV
jgi:hypothetical protein